ncbi:hypothetical protein EMCRGX_G011141 [Ephydatia muelleri]
MCVVVTVAFGVLAGFLCCALHILRAEVALLKSTMNASADEFSLKELRHDGRNTPSGFKAPGTEHSSFVTLGPGSRDATTPPDLPCKPAVLKLKPRAAPEEQEHAGEISGHRKEKAGLQLSASDYNIPADAVPVGQPHLGKKGESPQARKISFNLSSCPGEGNYTDVFDRIQGDRVQVVGSPLQQPSVVSRPPDPKLSSDAACPAIQTRKNGTVVLDGSRTLPRSSNTPSGDADLTDPDSDKAERRMSLPQSRLPSSKELVELDPRKRIFRLESQKRKRAGAAVEDRSGSDAAKGSGGDAAANASGSAAEYSVVNMVDKLKYRSGENSAKVEGSGAPAHYTPGAPEQCKDDVGVTA